MIQENKMKERRRKKEGKGIKLFRRTIKERSEKAKKKKRKKNDKKKRKEKTKRGKSRKSNEMEKRKMLNGKYRLAVKK